MIIKLLTAASATKKHILTGILVIYVSTIFLLTHIPLPPDTLPYNTDKVAHFGVYFGLAALLVLRLRWADCSWRRVAVVTGLVCIVYGILDEGLQIPIPGRTGEVNDLIADYCGAIVGTALATWALSRLEHKSFVPSPLEKREG